MPTSFGDKKGISQLSYIAGPIFVPKKIHVQQKNKF